MDRVIYIPIKTMKNGTISIGTILTGIALIVTGVFTSVVWVENSINQAVTPVQAQTQINTTAIASLQTNIEWIKAALDSNGIRPKSKATSTNE